MHVLLSALLLFASAPGYQDEVTKWRVQREAALKAEDGWLSVAGSKFEGLAKPENCASEPQFLKLTATINKRKTA